jgi:hypothetical protein
LRKDIAASNDARNGTRSWPDLAPVCGLHFFETRNYPRVPNDGDAEPVFDIKNAVYHPGRVSNIPTFFCKGTFFSTTRLSSELAAMLLIKASK